MKICGGTESGENGGMQYWIEMRSSRGREKA